MTDSPSPPDSNGRGQAGRFGAGNRFGKGNPHARRVSLLRATLLTSVTPGDMKDVVAALLAQAKAGDVAATKELLQRLLGPPVELDLIERLEILERRLHDDRRRSGDR
jgi:hypothetical protein